MITANETIGYGYNGVGDRLRQTINGVATSYTLDLNTGLTQVLADGTNIYLYGNGRIAQYANGPGFFLADALGSVRQLISTAEEVVNYKGFEPFGEVTENFGNATTPFGFTGEWTDPSDLVYLRSRYYDPNLNQFIQSDPITSNYRNPQDQNAFSYSRNNPINFTDPSGLSPIFPPEHPDHRDLTYWLYKEMSENANGYYLERIQQMLNSINPTQKARTVVGWIYLVKDNAKWDSKDNINRLMEGGEAILLSSNEGPTWYEYSVPGNIHYGFVGRAAGFSGSMLHMGASFAEVIDSAHKDLGEACCPQVCKDVVGDPWITLNVCIPLGCYYFNPEWVGTLFDDPADYWSVEFGVRLYDIFQKHMTYDQFRQHLAIYGYWLTPAPVIPDIRFEHPDWPYTVGYFDGPDTKKNKPIVDLLLGRASLGD